VFQLAREKGVSAYIGHGLNRWPAAHVLDVAHFYSYMSALTAIQAVGIDKSAWHRVYRRKSARSDGRSHARLSVPIPEIERKPV
jgi:hypothetical protein